MHTQRTLLKNCTITGFADEIDTCVDKQIALLKQLGISWVEYRSGDGKSIANYTLEEAKALKEKLDANGIKVSAIGSPIGKINIKEDFAPHLEKLDHIMDLAQILGTEYIRMFSFFMPEGEDPADYREEVFARTQAMVDLACRRNMILLHENEKDIYGDIGPRCLELMKQFYGPHYRCTFDFANFVQCGQDPLEAYEMLAPYVTYVHIKDALAKDGLVVPPGEGDGRLREVFALLDKAGYRGFLSLEPHLTSFLGLQGLEKNAAVRTRTDGEEAFTQAYEALLKLL